MRLGMLLFWLLPILAHVYVTARIARLLPCSRAKSVLAALVPCAAFALFLVNITRGIEALPLEAACLSYGIGYTWLFMLLYLAPGFLLLDFASLLGIIPRRRLCGSAAMTAAVALSAAAVFACGHLAYRTPLRTEISVRTHKPLPRPLRIVMLSDLHLGYHIRRAEFSRHVDRILAEKPDLVLIAGDIVDMSTRPLMEERAWEEFRRIPAPVIAVPGNHEYYSRLPGSLVFLEKAGIRVLRDSSAEILGIRVIGRDDRSNPARLALPSFAPRRDDIFSILLDHQPRELGAAQQCGIDFQFSGHTHHGQVWPVNLVTDAMYEVAYGGWQKGEARGYVSSGLGLWGGKFRIGTRSEYVVMRLEAAPSG